MIRAFTSEWIKFRRLSVLIGGGSMSLLIALGVYFGIARATTPGRTEGITTAVLRTDQGLTTILSRGGILIGVIVLIMVSAAVAAEYSQGTLRNLLVREPGRLRLMAGKFFAVLVFSMSAATVAYVIGIAVGFVAAANHNVSTTAWTSSSGIANLASLYGNIMLSGTAWAILGLFSALLFRSAAAAVGVSLAYGLVIEELITELWPDSAPQWLYGRLSTSIIDGAGVFGAQPVSSYGRSLVVVGVYALGLLIVGGVLLRVRDVSS